MLEQWPALYNILTIVSEAYTITVVLTLALALASVINYDRK